MSLLHRSFKAGKCKTSLKLAVARIKLLKNKREVQMKQMKKDLAHLLETGQEKTAMIRVEHVVREEKTMAAYDFLDIYCELVVARLPIIESQKNCPIDLKEAVSTIVFASPRCADIPELLDARKHFTAKYGKDFITSALELRPNCGVNRTVVENLSARAPDGQTKLKILTGIAQEYNVEWDAKAFGEKELKPPEDLLNGPILGNDNGRPAEPLGAQIPSHVQKPESSYVKNMSGSSQSSQPFDPTNIRTPSMTMHTSTEPRTSGGAAEGREFAHHSSQNANHNNPNRQNWNMDFKDATSAAQAAAESAERASLAARAAAELSGYTIPRQHSSGSHEQIPDQQRYRNERNSKHSLAASQDHSRRRPGVPNVEDDTEKTDVYCQNCSSEVEVKAKKPEEREVQSSHFGVESADHHQHMNEGIRRQSSGAFSSLSTDNGDVTSVSNLHKHGKDGRDHSVVDTAEEREVQFVDHDHYNKKSGHTNSMKEVSRRQSRESSASFSDDNGDASVSYLEEFGNDGRDHLFVDTAEGSTQSDTKQPTFDDYTSVIFDEPISDDETTGHKYGLYNSSPVTSLPSRFSENPDFWSPSRHKNDSHAETSTHSLFTKESYSPSESINKISSPAQSADLAPASFDDSDGLDSESEEETVNAKLSGRRESTISSEPSERVISSYPEKEAKVINTKPQLHSSSDESDSDRAYLTRNQDTKVIAGRETTRSSHVQPHASSLVDDEAMSYSPVIEERRKPVQSSRHSLSKGLKTEVDDSSYLSSESGNDLDFGRLRGGFRNKGYTRPPYRKGVSAAHERQETEDTKEQANTSVSSVLYDQKPHAHVRNELGSSSPRTASETPYDHRSHAHVRKEISSSSPKPSLSSPKTIFDSDSDEEEVVPRRGISGRVSHRTRVSDVNSLPTSTSGPRMTVTPSSPQSARSSGSRRSLRTNMSGEDSQLHSRLGEKPKMTEEHQSSKSTTPTKHSRHSEKVEVSRSSAVEQTCGSSLNKETPSRESSLKKAGHVHPKLPDYDSFAAHFESLRSNR